MKVFIIFILINATLILAQEFDVAQKPQQTRIGVGIMLTEQNIKGDLFSLKPLEYFNPITKEWLIEQFKPIKGYEGFYEVSNCGRVKSLKRITKHGGSFGGFVSTKERILRVMLNQYGYLRLNLRDNNGNQKSHRIHVLVWDAFGDKPRDGRIIQVDHKDENKQNNYIGNLQLLTNRQNVSKSILLNKKNGLPIGVCWNKRRGKYETHIWVENKRLSLGHYTNVEDASNAYQRKLAEII